MNLKVIILDFDGTLVESVGIKDKAFAELFSDYPEYIREIMDYHLAHNATVRFDKFRYIMTKIIKTEYNEDIEKNLSSRFSQSVLQRTVECPYVSGAKEFLDYFVNRCPLYLASASPAGELDYILKARSLQGYFRNIYAIPWKKSDVVADVIAQEKAEPAEVLMIGDSYEDYQAAFANGVSFVGRNSGKSFAQANVPIFSDLLDMKKYIESLS